MWVSSNQTVLQQPTTNINMYNQNCMYPFVNCMYCKFPRINDSWFLIPDSSMWSPHRNGNFRYCMSTVTRICQNAKNGIHFRFSVAYYVQLPCTYAIIESRISFMLMPHTEMKILSFWRKFRPWYYDNDNFQCSHWLTGEIFGEMTTIFSILVLWDNVENLTGVTEIKAQISQCTCSISRNAPHWNRNVHISAPRGCIVSYGEVPWIILKMSSV